ncbi:MurR/RpiR family transcriptional regulator (plasmid) [Rhizobium sp. T1470]|uniref:MurR/RpiR family transcriptional regulator n=1 Tax=unclassified Rhizobium TaxID=2613769 RepID=UPI001AAF3212|nr:MurR/RpiR family transcriptional regulator [Rhizobium sp. T1473]MCA0806370.1 MurR/RpiR family transcriptional regulator [Rhizobium sp. T1473]
MDLPVVSAIKDSYERLPRQMKVAARWLVDHPTEVALLSMREQARRARVPPTTLTRLAKRLGFDGFDNLKVVFANGVRKLPQNYTGCEEESIARGEAEGDGATVSDTVEAFHSYLSDLAQPSTIAALAAAADLMVEARQIFCIGLRSSFPAANLMHCLGSLIDLPMALIDGVGGTRNDALLSASRRDVLLVVSVRPYSRYTMQIAEFAATRDAKLVALTDSELSPIAKVSEIVIRVRTEMPSVFHTMTPAFAAVECLLQLIAARRGSCALQALAANEADLAALY